MYQLFVYIHCYDHKSIVQEYPLSDYQYNFRPWVKYIRLLIANNGSSDDQWYMLTESVSKIINIS